MIHFRFSVVLFCASLLSGISAQAESKTFDISRIVPLDSPLARSLFGSDVTIIMLHGTGEITFPAGCGFLGGQTFPSQEAIAIKNSTGPQDVNRPFAQRLEVGLIAPLPPGTRIRSWSQDVRECCLSGDGDPVSCRDLTAELAVWLATGQIVNSAEPISFVFESTEILKESSVGVVTGKNDNSEISDLIFSTKGEKPIESAVLAEVLLRPGDRISHPLYVETDPETGVHTYVGILN